jgi:DHA1 family tetracycline resistance protein-like MFS transporter
MLAKKILGTQVFISMPGQKIGSFFNPEDSDTAAQDRRLQQKRRALGLIFSIMLMDVIGISILYPVSAYIVRQYSSQALMVTLLSVIYSAAQFLAAPALGKLSDRYGRRPVLLVSVFGSAVGYLIFGLGGALWVLFLSRLIDGFSGGNMSTASAYIADVSEPQELVKNFTLVGMAWGIGLVLGPAMGGVLGQFNLRAPAFASAALSLAALGFSFFLLPESLPVGKRRDKRLQPKDFNPFVSIGDIGRIPGLAVMLVALCLFNAAFSAINSTETLFIIQKFSAQPWQIGLLTMLVGIVIALIQPLLIPRTVSRFGEKFVAVASLFLQTTGALAVWSNPVFILVYPLVILRSAASGFIFPTLSALSVKRVSPNQQGLMMGVTTALTSLMGIFSPVVAGLVYDHLSPGAPYGLAAILFVAAAGLLLRKKNP